MDGVMEKSGTEPADLSERPQEAGGDKSRRATTATLLGEAESCER